MYNVNEKMKKIKTLNFSISLARLGMGWLDHTVAYLKGVGGFPGNQETPLGAPTGFDDVYNVLWS